MGNKVSLSNIAGDNASFSIELCVVNASFWQKFDGITSPSHMAGGPTVPMVTISDIRLVFLRINLQKVTGPGCVPRAGADQLAGAFTDIFNLSDPIWDFRLLQEDHRYSNAQVE